MPIQDTCNNVAQLAQQNVWLNLIALFIPIAGAVAIWIKTDADNRARCLEATRIEEKVKQVKKDTEKIVQDKGNTIQIKP